MRANRARRAVGAVVLLVAGALASGCTAGTAVPLPSGSPTGRPFTVMVTGAIATLDPAVAVSRTDSILVSSVYQRLMQVLPSGDLKPDAATDCAFTSRLVYECSLPTTLKFHNGDQVTSTDVRFSIQRALRLNVRGTSVGLLSSLARIETPNPQTVRFVLSTEDNQFGYALSGQAVSIVDHNTFDPDSALPLATLPVGSGPFSVAAISPAGADLKRYIDYLGPTVAQLAALRLQVATDSVAAEAQIQAGTVDVAWQCLDNAAQARIDNEIAVNNGKTAKGFIRVPLSGVQVTRLYWNPASRWRTSANLRLGVARALQQDRSLDSVVPIGVPDRVKAFPVGGRPKLPKLNGQRIILSLGYDASDPAQADAASLLRDRLENLDGVSVRLGTDANADLLLTTAPAWIDNALGWLQLYLSAPLASSKAKLASLETHARAATGTARSADISELQLQAATDNTVLPVSQGAAFELLGPDARMANGNFASGQQLGLWGFYRG